MVRDGPPMFATHVFHKYVADITRRVATAAIADAPAPIVLFKDLATEYIERHCKKKKESWKQDVTGSTPNSARTGTTSRLAPSSGEM